MPYVGMLTLNWKGTHTDTHILLFSSSTDGYTPWLLAALDLQWPVSLQLLMPRGACFTALPQGPNRLSISRWAAALFPINSPVQESCKHPGVPAWREERGGGGRGGEFGREGSWQERLRWNHAMLLGQRAVWRGWTCHFLSFCTHTKHIGRKMHQCTICTNIQYSNLTFLFFIFLHINKSLLLKSTNKSMSFNVLLKTMREEASLYLKFKKHKSCNSVCLKGNMNEEILLTTS